MLGPLQTRARGETIVPRSAGQDIACLIASSPLGDLVRGRIQVHQRMLFTYARYHNRRRG